MTDGANRRQGTMLLVATPIGNLGDLSPRAVRALAAADTIACEDTRRARALLSHAGIPAPELIAVHDHNEAAQVRTILARLDAGKHVVVVSDAGTPAISDPGERLVAAAVAAGHAVQVVPGPSAAVAALVVSGLPTGRFCFEGFLPRRGKARRERLGELHDERRTVVVYEAPHRVRETLADLAEALGPQRKVAITRELTKAFEETWRGSLAGACEWVSATEPRGEYVLVVGGAPAPAQPSEAEVEAAVRAELAAGADRRTAVAAVASRLRVPRRQAYAAATRVVATIEGRG